jgi:hypothetical protein
MARSGLAKIPFGTLISLGVLPSKRLTGRVAKSFWIITANYIRFYMPILKPVSPKPIRGLEPHNQYDSFTATFFRLGPNFGFSASAVLARENVFSQRLCA